MKKSARLFWFGALVVLVILGGVFFAADQKPQTSVWPTVRVGYLAVAAELPLFVAVEQKYFSAEGLTVELQQFTSSNELGNAATADRVDIMAGTASNVVFDIATSSGKQHRAFAFNIYSNRPNHVTDHLLVKSGSEIKALTQLRGKRVASFPGSVNKIFVQLILEKHGVPRDTYEYTELPPPNWGPALQSGAIDAVSALEPTATQIVKDGIAVSIFPGFYADLMADVPLSGHWLAADYLQRADPKQIAAFLRAYDKAIQFCREHESEARQYLAKYANVREDIVGDVDLNLWLRRAEIDVAALQGYVDLLADNGALLKKVNANEFLSQAE